MSKLDSILGAIGTGLGIVGQFALPGLGGLIVKVATLGVHVAEEVGQLTGAKGQAKKDIALAIASDTLNAIATAKGVTVNSSEIMQHLDRLIEEAVWLANFAGDFTHSQ
jgi:hypothetical protein